MGVLADEVYYAHHRSGQDHPGITQGYLQEVTENNEVIIRSLILDAGFYISFSDARLYF